MNFRKTRPGALALAFTLTLALGPLPVSAARKYVASPAAKLMAQPRMSAKVLIRRLRPGTSVRTIGARGLFYKVRVRGRVGWISRLYLSNRRPGRKLSLVQRLNKGARIKGRRRASSYSETAAARGHGKSETLRTRGNAHMYDFTGIRWIESQTPGAAAVRKFLKQGKLKP